MANRWTDFFAMTRRERRGTIVLLVVIAALLLATLSLRNCSTADVEVDQTAIEQFEQQADSLRTRQERVQQRRKTKSKDKSDKKSQKRKSNSKKKKEKPSRQPVEPHRLDPVPQF